MSVQTPRASRFASLYCHLTLITVTVTAFGVVGSTTGCNSESKPVAQQTKKSPGARQPAVAQGTPHFGSMAVSAGPLADPDELNPPDPAIKVDVLTLDEVMATIPNTGIPTIVDIWSLNCEPCMREFPGLVRLQKEYGDRLRCVSLNTDYYGARTKPPETFLTAVMEFLRTHDARTANFICSTASEDAYKQLEIPSVPAVFIYDAEGKLVKRFIDADDTIGFTYDEDVVPFVRDLVANSPEPPAKPAEPGEQTEASAPAANADAVTDGEPAETTVPDENA